MHHSPFTCRHREIREIRETGYAGPVARAAGSHGAVGRHRRRAGLTNLPSGETAMTKIDTAEAIDCLESALRHLQSADESLAYVHACAARRKIRIADRRLKSQGVAFKAKGLPPAGRCQADVSGLL